MATEQQQKQQLRHLIATIALVRGGHSQRAAEARVDEMTEREVDGLIEQEIVEVLGEEELEIV